MTEKSTQSDKAAKSKGDAGKDARAKDSPAASAVKSETIGSHASPKKRRKVNHGEFPFACGMRTCDRDRGPSYAVCAIAIGWEGWTLRSAVLTVRLICSLCLLSSLGKSSTSKLPRRAPGRSPRHLLRRLVVPWCWWGQTRKDLFEEIALLTDGRWSRGTAYDLRFGTTSPPFACGIPIHSVHPVALCGRLPTRLRGRRICVLTRRFFVEPTKRRDPDNSAADEEGSSNNDLVTVSGMPRSVDVSDAAGQQILPDSAIGMPPSTVQPGNITSSGGGLDANSQSMMAYNDWMGGQNQFQDMHSLHPSYMFNAPEVTNEYNLLGDFLSNSLLDDGAIFPDQNMQGIYSDPSLINSVNNLNVPNGMQQTQLLPPAQNQTPQGDSIQRPTSTVGNDKARETYYMTAADPSGSDPPEERMNKLLKAKYDAGLLKPFNYVKGYARLNQYMEKNMHQSSRQKILRQLDKFRPKFRERMQSLTDIELILVEMWFERSLMEYDRVFASMAIPACCWRRTGEIFRGNNEMAQLIDVPIESLRDGKLAIHEIIVEDQLVSYWEKFGAIAFDNTQKAMLTSCTLKSPNPNAAGEGIPCCFSFTIRRDNHNIPSMIVGNFLPTQRIHK
ncbi:Zinc cluster transcription factor acuM [Penicillium argentinense]|uniref:Zinc cluster transcription factor acuM n=1 Tax=Penicillium argentinense TaxID=1131581 RepID=A0A9W9KP54_9EURO|nr:Zinc cluster transcription factor acuM [Penicillium argentinense]KAJ5112678.1 Zinc cluster transcription factor acuM [Penicillium argentinense]